MGIGRRTGGFFGLLGALALALASSVVAVPATVADAQGPTVGSVPDGFEVSPEPVSTWGVATLMPSETVVFESLVWDFAEIDGVVYVAGRFGNVRQTRTAPLQDQAYLAAFDADTGAWIPGFAPQLDGPAFSLETDGNKLFVGGEFTSVGDVETGPLAAVDPSNGNLISSWAPDISWTTGTAVVMDLDIANNSLYAGGNFAWAGTDFAPRLAKLDLTSAALDTNFGGAASGARVWTLEASESGDRLYVGGYFEVLNGEAHKWFGALDGLTGELVPGVVQGTPEGMPNCCKQNPFDIAVHGDHVFVARESHLLEILNTADLSREGYYLTSFGGGDYQATEVIGDRLYTGGHFWANQGYSEDVVPFTNTAWQAANLATMNDPSQTHVIWSAAFDANSAEAIPSYLMDMGMKSGIWAIHGSENGRLWLGGDVQRAGSGWAGGFATFEVAPATPRGENLAAGQPVTMSSVDTILNGTLDGTRAVDRALAGQTRHDGIRAFTAQTQLEDDPWIEVDLGSANQIGVIRLFERAVGNFNGASNGTLFLSNDPFVSNDADEIAAQPGVSAYDVGGIGRWTDIEVFRSARYVRYQLAGNRQLTIDSIEVFAQVGDAPTLPAPATVRVTREETRRAVINYAKVPDAASHEILLDGVIVGTDNDGWFSFVDLDPGTTYTASVRGISADGTPGASTDVAIRTLGGGVTLEAPTSVTVTREELRRAVINYTLVPGAASHELLLDGVVVGTDNDRWFTFLDLDPATSYEAAVRGVSADGTPGPETTATITTKGSVDPGGELPAPETLNVTRVERRRIVVNYALVPGADTHEILLDGVVVGTDNDRWFTFLGLEPGTTYELSVRGVSADGTPGASATLVETTQAG